MGFLKTILKLLGGLLIGGAIGLVLAGAGLIIFTDTTFAEYLDKLSSASFRVGIIAGFVGICAFVVSEIVLIIAHEAGHLVGGLLSGYKFVSFRIGNLTFIRKNGHLKIKKYSLAGTGGQCLMCPPDGDPDTVPTTLYLAGGLLANIVCFIVVLPLLFLNLPPFVTEALVIFIFADVLSILLNGIPMKMNGVGNDAKDIMHLRKNRVAKHGLLTQLRSNALIQDGTRPGELPEKMFIVTEKSTIVMRLKCLYSQCELLGS